MDFRPIRTRADCRRALKEVDRLWEADPGAPEGDRVDVLVTLIEACEAKHHPIPAPDPIAAIEFMMEQNGATRRDLELAIGSRGRVSEFLIRKRPLTLPMVRALSALVDIPTDVLVQPYETRSATQRHRSCNDSDRKSTLTLRLPILDSGDYGHALKHERSCLVSSLTPVRSRSAFLATGD